MVECEFYNDTLMEAMKDCFNRYMVECESKNGNNCCACSLVLIDTWWNVNPERQLAFC